MKEIYEMFFICNERVTEKNDNFVQSNTTLVFNINLKLS